MSGIYIIRNKDNGKMYIGQSKNLESRWAQHKTELRANRHPNRYLQGAWNKHGEDAFEFEILEYCSLDELDEKEQYYIKFYDSGKKGYNLNKGGQGIKGFKHTEEQISKMRRIQSPLIVLQFDLEFNVVARFEGGCVHAAKHYGFTKECIRKCCEHIQKKRDYKGFYWLYEKEYNMPDFSWEKYFFSETLPFQKEKQKPKSIRKICQYDLKRNLVKIWDSFSEIEEAGFKRNQVNTICNKRRNKKTHHGFIWAYEDYDWSDGYFDNLDDPYKNAIEQRKKKVWQILPDGEYVRLFSSVTEAAKSVGVGDSKISCAAKTHGVSGGFFWAFEGDNWFLENRDILASRYRIGAARYGKPVLKLTLDGEEIASYKNLTEAAISNGRIEDAANICRAIKTNKTCLGYRWKYLNK